MKSVITDIWRTPVDFIHDKENEYFGILSSDIMETSTPLPVGLSQCQASHVYIPVDFSAFNLK
jgi:hypothetical protein